MLGQDRPDGQASRRKDNALHLRRQPDQPREGKHPARRRRYRHDHRSTGGGWLGDLTQGACPPSNASRIQVVGEDHGVREFHAEPDRSAGLQRGVARQPHGAGRGAILVTGPEQAKPGDSQARHHRPGSEHHRRRPHAQRARPAAQRDGVQVRHHVRHVHVHAAHQRGRRADQESAPDLVSGGHQVGHDDDDRHEGRPPDADAGPGRAAGQLDFDGRRLHQPHQSHESRARVQPKRP
ncbi:hypothetical protein VPH35_117493 [Triticum aestivum]